MDETVKTEVWLKSKWTVEASTHPDQFFGSVSWTTMTPTGPNWYWVSVRRKNKASI